MKPYRVSPFRRLIGKLTFSARRRQSRLLRGLDEWNRYEWGRVFGRQLSRPETHAPWLNELAVAYRRAIGREEPFLG